MTWPRVPRRNGEGVLCTVKPHTAPRTTKVKIILECTRGLPGRHLHIFCILISGHRGRGRGLCRSGRWKWSGSEFDSVRNPYDNFMTASLGFFSIWV